MAKQTQVLENGVHIETSEAGWNPNELAGQPGLFAGWKADAKGASAAHYSLGVNIALALKEKVPAVYLGDFKAIAADGNEELIPVFDPIKINEEVRNAIIEKYDLNVQKLARVAGSRSVSAKVTDVRATFNDLDPEVMAQLEALDPTLFEKLKKL